MLKNSIHTTLWALVAFLSWVPGVAKGVNVVHSYDLLPQVAALVNNDGTVVWLFGTGNHVLLTGRAPAANSGRRDPGFAPQTFVVTEGVEGGHRGFSASKDDDGDGAMNEDPLDGRDNDNDGRIDEDFAAISDGMVVVDSKNTGAHTEFYHWSNPHLRGTTFMNVSGIGFYELSLGAQEWRETSVTGMRHSLSGKSENSERVAFVAQSGRTDSGALDNDCMVGERLWVGAIILAPRPGEQAILDGGQLKFHLDENPLPVAVCVAESWTRLNQMLDEAARVHLGVVDPITGHAAEWIASPLCATCRLSSAPSVRWITTADGGLQLTLSLAEGMSGAIDPDLFRLAGHPLGAPDEVIWKPDLGPEVKADWRCSRVEAIDRGSRLSPTPYEKMEGLLEHSESGRLVFSFHNSAWEIPESLAHISGAYLDGRPFTADLNSAPPAVTGLDLGKPDTRDEPLRISTQEPRLSPKLLEGYPNPFPEAITLRFRVPSTVGEAFVWPSKEDGETEKDLSAAVPWASGNPQVSVKIYSISGEELVTLFSGSQGPGENTVQWTGRDSFGRPVASGTYFCKLQMDKWSTTHRIVFLR
ncbi:MAG: hypothetical protein ACI9UK_001473 [Candidatus Krumholzibacteriia bacterium]|jgi:hypothetical protein